MKIENREFQYISQKILDAPFNTDPFRHILIEDFLSKEHLSAIVEDQQVHFREANDTRDLLGLLAENHYKVQNFPGCTNDVNEYLWRYENNSFPSGRKGQPVEAYGITFRLSKHNNPLIEKLVTYMNGEEFKSALETKFNIGAQTNIITAIQKNLSHYEISPHPDIREKALTYLLNINKNSAIDDLPVHTHLLKFKKEWEFIPEFWKNNLQKNRCWVPWDWCETRVVTNKNNSIVLFSPSIDTLHGVKMAYDHTKFQRTQLYGNLMSTSTIAKSMNYRELEPLRNKGA